MPSSAIKRKLVSANNAWKGITTLLRSKFFLLKRSKAFKRTATGLTSAISTVLGRRRRRRRFRLKKRSLPRLPSDPAGCNRTKIQHQLQRHGFAPVYVDDLFAKPATPVRIQVVQPAVFVGGVLVDKVAAAPEGAGGLVAAGASHGSSSKVVKAEPIALVGGGLGKTAPGDLISEMEGRGGGSSSSAVRIPQLEGVDLRAELFIAKFKEEMRRQR